jgi:hypothetical protein
LIYTRFDDDEVVGMLVLREVGRRDESVYGDDVVFLLAGVGAGLGSRSRSSGGRGLISSRGGGIGGGGGGGNNNTIEMDSIWLDIVCSTPIRYIQRIFDIITLDLFMDVLGRMIGVTTMMDRYAEFIDLVFVNGCGCCGGGGGGMRDTTTTTTADTNTNTETTTTTTTTILHRLESFITTLCTTGNERKGLDMVRRHVLLYSKRVQDIVFECMFSDDRLVVVKAMGLFIDFVGGCGCGSGDGGRESSGDGGCGGGKSRWKKEWNVWDRLALVDGDCYVSGVFCLSIQALYGISPFDTTTTTTSAKTTNTTTETNTNTTTESKTNTADTAGRTATRDSRIQDICTVLDEICILLQYQKRNASTSNTSNNTRTSTSNNQECCRLKNVHGPWFNTMHKIIQVGCGYIDDGRGDIGRGGYVKWIRVLYRVIELISVTLTNTTVTTETGRLSRNETKCCSKILVCVWKWCGDGVQYLGKDEESGWKNEMKRLEMFVVCVCTETMYRPYVVHVEGRGGMGMAEGGGCAMVRWMCVHVDGILFPCIPGPVLVDYFQRRVALCARSRGLCGGEEWSLVVSSMDEWIGGCVWNRSSVDEIIGIVCRVVKYSGEEKVEGLVKVITDILDLHTTTTTTTTNNKLLQQQITELVTFLQTIVTNRALEWRRVIEWMDSIWFNSIVCESVWNELCNDEEVYVRGECVKLMGRITTNNTTNYTRLLQMYHKDESIYIRWLSSVVLKQCHHHVVELVDDWVIDSISEGVLRMGVSDGCCYEC